MYKNLPDNLRDLDEQLIKNETLSFLKGKIINVDKFAHKGTRGHAAIIAGSHGMMGAAILSVMAANKSGAGKVTALVPVQYFGLIHTSIPEALVADVLDPKIDYTKFDSIGFGPGLGNKLITRNLIDQVFSTNRPLVIDADGLNFLSQNKDQIDEIPQNSILTPHLKEWERLFGSVHTDKERIEKSIEIANQKGFNIIIKGHISCLITPEKQVFFNATGNAGMAKGGSGDVLTGLISGLLAQGYEPTIASILGMYIHGLAGDLAKLCLGEETMTASDQIRFFSDAFSNLKKELENL